MSKRSIPVGLSAVALFSFANYGVAQTQEQLTAEEAFPSDLSFTDFDLVFEDEFDLTNENGDPILDSYYWTAEEREQSSPASKRGSFPHPEAVQVMADGTVVLSAYRDESTARDPNGELRNGVLTSKEKFHASYGYWEATIKWENIASGTAAAFWMMPYATPNSPEAGAELDVIEIRGRRAGGYWTDDAQPFDEVNHVNGFNYLADKTTGEILNISPSSYDSALHKKIYDISDDLNFGVHWDGYSANQNSIWATLQPNGEGNSLVDGAFHTYGLLWTPAGYTLYFDGEEVLSIPREDDPATPDFNESWLSTEKNANDATLISYTYPKSGLTKTNFAAADEKAVSQALEHLILSIEVRDPDYASQDNWVGPLYELGPQGDPANTKMIVDSVRVYEMKSLQAQQSPAQPNAIGDSTFIAAEDYDNGGQGVAFMDRYDSGPDAVFTQAEREAHTPAIDIADFGGSDYYIHSFSGREWVEYTVSPTADGYYAVSVDAGNPAINYPTSIENGKARTTLLVSADHDALGKITIDASTETATGKIRHHALPTPVGIFGPTVMNVQSVNNSTAQATVDGNTTNISLDTYFDGLLFQYLGNVIECREAEDATVTGNISNGGEYLVGFNNAGTVEFDEMPGWDGGDAQLLIRYSVVDNGANTPFLKVSVNDNIVQEDSADLKLALEPDDTLFDKGYERNYYRYIIVDIPADFMVADSVDTNGDPVYANSIQIISDGSSNEEVRIDWIALASEVSTGETISLEAEDATLAGSAFVGGDASASSGQFVNGLWSVNSAVEWTVNATATGDATIRLTYAYDSSGVTTNRSVVVNGTTVASLTFDGDNASFTGVATATIPLNAGANTIWIGRLGNDAGGVVKFDVLDVQMPGGSAPLDLKIQAEAINAPTGDAYSVLLGNATISNNVNADEGAFVDGLNQAFAGVEFYLPDSVPAGPASLTISYATFSGGTVTKAVEVNGTVINYGFSQSNSWTDFIETDAINITLKGDGSDTIRIWRKHVDTDDQGSLRIDYIMLSN
ncbi:CBM35 domain-containing protein [Cerasicoccus maritimus]|uniref:CBM35 domain-containing protein n=1 Tax=Cerasicoccus maritimus TaxID=490089 RepID=UPI002852DB38|nr:CBM35 domain-containing protein [Cerasicoccus maritimus]